MDTSQLLLDQWDDLNAAQCEQIARSLLLPELFRFAGVEYHALGDQHRCVAFFDWNGARFALIPGGTVTLGYDRQQPFVPSPGQQASWQWTQHEWDALPLEDYLDRCLTPLRTVTLQPFLLEVAAIPYGRTPLEEWGPGAYHVQPFAWQEVVTLVTAQGFRLPSSDEWEYACAAGSRTLFRWGNDCPVDQCCGQQYSEWDAANHPNAFGLLIGTNSYQHEYCAEPTIWRGGDGGGTNCGGYGCFAVWLTLASAYWEPNHDPTEEHFGLHVRRAYSLA